MRRINPHLAYGGTTCPGERWREWVPQLRAAALLEEGMTPEDERKVQDMITASLRGWIGPRDQKMARIDSDLHEHIRDSAAHSDEEHEHKVEVKLS